MKSAFSFFVRFFFSFCALVTAWLLGLGFFYGWVVHGIAPPVETLLPQEAIVVLTGDRGRIERGFFLFQNKRASQLLISGVSAEKDRLFSEKFKHPDLTLGYKAKNTVGNAEEVREWVAMRKIQSFYLVTSDYHMARSLFELQSQMPRISIVPYPVISEGKGRFYKIFQEYHKFLFSFFRLTTEKIFRKLG
jgi:uncharacterized SAM-binding protein YcdF (DUF218 family)